MTRANFMRELAAALDAEEGKRSDGRHERRIYYDRESVCVVACGTRRVRRAVVVEWGDRPAWSAVALAELAGLYGAMIAQQRSWRSVGS